MSKSQADIRYEVITQKSDNGDLIIPLPPILLKQLGWKEGDSVDFAVDDKGRIIIKTSNGEISK